MTDIFLPVTFTLVSVLVILMIPLTGWVGLRRGETLRGDGGDPVLFKRIRIHGNLMENAPLFVFVLGAAEATGLEPPWLWLAITTFIVGRGLHYALYDTQQRGLAMLVTLLPGVFMGLWLLVQVWL